MSGCEADSYCATARPQVSAYVERRRTDTLVGKSYAGWAPLHLAAHNGHTAAVEALLQAGARAAPLSVTSAGNTFQTAPAVAGSTTSRFLLLPSLQGRIHGEKQKAGGLRRTAPDYSTAHSTWRRSWFSRQRWNKQEEERRRPLAEDRSTSEAAAIIVAAAAA